MPNTQKPPERHSERQIGWVIAEQILLHRADRTATVTELKQVLPQYMKLTSADKAQSPSRPNEALWQQRVGNLVSHRKDKKTNLILDGVLEYLPKLKALRLTDDGVRHLRSKGKYPNSSYNRA